MGRGARPTAAAVGPRSPPILPSAAARPARRAAGGGRARAGRRGAGAVARAAPPTPPEAEGPGGASLEDRIASGEFSTGGPRLSKKERLTRPLRKLAAVDRQGGGRAVAKLLADRGRKWQENARRRMPEATVGGRPPIPGRPAACD